MAIDLNYDTLSNGITLVTLTGTMDAPGAQAIDQGFNAISLSYDKIIVNFEKVDYLASMGIRTIIMGAKAVQRRNGKLVILKASLDVVKVLSESGVDSLIPMFQDYETAVKMVLK